MMHEQRIADHERLVLWRRSLGLSQRKMASKLRMRRDDYARQERSERECEVDIPAPYERITFRTLTVGERCFLLRWRANLTQAELAQQVGILRLHVWQTETNRLISPVLLKHWKL